MTAIAFPTLAQKLLAHLQQEQQAMVALLTEFVQLETPSLDPLVHAPLQARMAAVLDKIHYRVHYLTGQQTGGAILALPKHRVKHQPLQLILGHSDTVWDSGTILGTMPLQQRDRRLYGPGVYDMKAGLVQALFALKSLQDLRLQPDVTPILLINTDEEIGSPESQRQIIRLAKMVNRVLVLEPSLGLRGDLKTARKGVGHFRLKILGRAAHAGLEPEKGISAIHELAFAIQKLFALNDPTRGITVNVGNVDGGIRPNVVAPESTAVIDVRVLHHEDMPTIEAKIRALEPTLTGIGYDITGHFEHPPMEPTPGNRQLWQQAQQAIAELGLDIGEGTAGGSSDGNTTSLYAPTLDGLGAKGDAAHAVGEYVELTAMPERAALLARLLLMPPTERGGTDHE